MRIRKRSIAALSSEKPGLFSSEEAAAAAVAATEKEFLLPLVAAVVDIQAKARLEGKDFEITPTARQAIAQIHTRPVQKWRNALLRSKAKAIALQAGEEEEEKGIHKWIEREQVVKKQRSKLVVAHVSPETQDGMKMRKEESMSRKKEKVLENDKKVLEDNKKVLEDNKNLHAGSQCRRRNGRGWRCSERTLVGYHLCEHHLGKGRLRSINNNNNNNTSAVVVKDKGTKFKDLRLIHAAAPPL